MALQNAAWMAAALFTGAVIVSGKIYGKKEMESRAVLVTVLLFSVLCGFGQMEMEKQWAEDCIGLGLDGEKVWIEGTAENLEEGTGQDGKGIRITLSGSRMAGKPAAVLLGRVDVFFDSISGDIPEVGRKVQVYGEMKKYEAAKNPGEFDFQTYYLGLHSCYGMYGEKGKENILVMGMEKPVKYFLFKIKKRCGRILDGLMEETEAGVMKAMILGDKTGMDEDIRNLYQRNGIAHILAISGLHISLLGAGLYRLLRKTGAGFGISAGGGAVLLILYGTMTGLSSSSFRAIMMMGIFFLAEYMGRTYDMTSAAGLAGIILMVQSPFLILQSGFQLSFAAVLSISILGEYLEKMIKPKRGICQQMVMGAAVQIGTCPIVLYHFYQYPVYGFFLNLAVIPLMAYVVVSGIGGVLLGSQSYAFGKASLGTCHYVLSFYETLCMEAEKLPMGNAVMGRPAMWQIALYGVMLGTGLIFLGKIRREDALGKKAHRFSGQGFQRACYLTALCFCLFLVLHPALRRLRGNNLVVTFLDVGQGDGILVEKGNTVIFIDGGSSDKRRLGEKTLEPCLKSKGISLVNYVIISHGDEDHISGIRYLLTESRGIKIENLVLPVLGKEEEIQEKLKNEMREQMGKYGRRKEDCIAEMKAGDRIRAEDGTMEIVCLYPKAEDRADNRNQQSLVLMMNTFGLNILFTGDTEEACERRMTEREEIRNILEQTDVLKAAHHGSSSSTCGEFLDVMGNRLKYAVISCGEKNRFGHPSKEVVEQLEKRNISIFFTKDKGAVILTVGKKGIKWKGYFKNSFRKK